MTYYKENKSKYDSELILSPNFDNTFTIYQDYKTEFCVVPAGYKTNGADVPRVAWSYIPPNTPRYLPAIVVHDYLCDEEKYKEADEAFRIILLDIEDSNKTRIMVKSVELYTKYIRKMV